MTYYEANIFPTTMNRSLWRIHDKSPMTSQVWNTQALDLSIGTGAGFVCGYDTGGLKITASSPPSSGLYYNSGVYYVRTAETVQNVNHHGAYRVCIPESGSFFLHPYDGGATGWSMIYVGYDGKIGECIGNDTGGYVYAGTGGGWNYPNNKVLLARIARDNIGGTGNAFPQAKIVDERQFTPQLNLYENQSDTGSTLNYNGDIKWNGNAYGKMPGTYYLVIPSSSIIGNFGASTWDSNQYSYMESTYFALVNSNVSATRIAYIGISIIIPISVFGTITVTSISIYMIRSGGSDFACTWTCYRDADITNATSPASVGTATDTVTTVYTAWTITPSTGTLGKNITMYLYASPTISANTILCIYGVKVTYTIT